MTNEKARKNFEKIERNFQKAIDKYCIIYYNIYSIYITRAREENPRIEGYFGMQKFRKERGFKPFV